MLGRLGYRRIVQRGLATRGDGDQSAQNVEASALIDARILIGCICGNCAEYADDWTVYCDEWLCAWCFYRADRSDLS